MRCINKNIYKHIQIFVFIIILIFIVYNFIIFIKNHYALSSKLIEPFSFKKIGKSIKKGVQKATSTVSDVAKKAAEEAKKAAEQAKKIAEEEAKRIAEETRKAAEEAKRLAEEAAQAIQIQNAIKELNRSIDRASDIFDEIGDGVSQIKGLGSSYAKNAANITKPFDKL